MLYGASLFAQVVAPKLGLALIDTPDDWLPSVPKEFLRRELVATTLGEARKLTERKFVKPAAEKSFPAQVYHSGEALHHISQVYEASTPVLVSDPVTFTVEYRFFMLYGTPQAGSIYLLDGSLTEGENVYGPPDEYFKASEFALQVGQHMGSNFPPAIVLDVGLIHGEWAVVEANPAWGSGLLDCDPAGVLKVLQRASVPVCYLPPVYPLGSKAALTFFPKHQIDAGADTRWVRND